MIAGLLRIHQERGRHRNGCSWLLTCQWPVGVSRRATRRSTHPSRMSRTAVARWEVPPPRRRRKPSTGSRRSLGILKSIGMTSRQVVVMTVASVNHSWRSRSGGRRHRRIRGTRPPTLGDSVAIATVLRVSDLCPERGESCAGIVRKFFPLRQSAATFPSKADGRPGFPAPRGLRPRAGEGRGT